MHDQARTGRTRVIGRPVARAVMPTESSNVLAGTTSHALKGAAEPRPVVVAAVLVCNILQLLWRQRWPAVEFARAPAPCIAHFVA
jgi:hypothetical protein